MGNAKKFKRRLTNVLPIVLRDSPLPDVTIDNFEAGTTLGRSTPKISNYLAKIRPHVVKLDEHLRPYFGGERASEQLDAVKSALDAADAVQEADIASLPEATQKVYEAKGRVLQDIEDLNRIARNAFEGNADAIALFNKDILPRARQERKKKTE